MNHLSELDAFVSPSFTTYVDSIQNGSLANEVLVHSARELVSLFSKSDNKKNVFEFEGHSFRLDKILLAILEEAHTCGGDSGTRYAASTILAAGHFPDATDMLRAVAIIWVTRFLFICE